VRDDIADDNGESLPSGWIEDQLQVFGVRGTWSHVDPEALQPPSSRLNGKCCTRFRQ